MYVIVFSMRVRAYLYKHLCLFVCVCVCVRICTSTYKCVCVHSPVITVRTLVRARVAHQVAVAHVVRERGGRGRGHVAQRARVRGHVRALVLQPQVRARAADAAHRARVLAARVHVLAGRTDEQKILELLCSC